MLESEERADEEGVVCYRFQFWQGMDSYRSIRVFYLGLLHRPRNSKLNRNDIGALLTN